MYARPDWIGYLVWNQDNSATQSLNMNIQNLIKLFKNMAKSVGLICSTVNKISNGTFSSLSFINM